MSALIAQIVAYPIHVVRVKQALDTKQPWFFNTFLETFDFLNKKDGFKGMHWGFSISIFNNLLVLFTIRHQNTSPSFPFLIAGLKLLTFPLEVF